MSKKIICWILVIIWMGIIFYFSSMNGEISQNQSRGFLYHTITKIITFFDKNIDEEEKKQLVIKYDPIIRKIAHISIYFILEILVFIALNQYDLNIKKIIFYSFLICIIYACTDELHQTFVSKRSGKIIDVLIDTIGISFGIIPCYLRRKL